MSHADQVFRFLKNVGGHVKVTKKNWSTLANNIVGMRKILSLLFLLTCLFPQPGKSQAVSSEIIATLNIRFNNPGDGVNAWSNRKERVYKLIQEVNPQILCLQEVLNNQIKDLEKAMPGFGWTGAGRDDGIEKGEYVPIFYRKDLYKLIRTDNFWLAPDPHTPGLLAWDAACPRMVTWICLKKKATGDTLFVFNTHFDHIGVKAREMSAKLIVHAADSLAGNHRTIVTGDFNSSPRDAGYLNVISGGFADSRLITQTPPEGPEHTFTGFDITKPHGDRIDYILVRNLPRLSFYKVRPDHDGKNYYSDHLMVVAGF